MKRLILAGLIVGLGGTVQAQQVGIANPAAVFCISEGGAYEIVQTDAGAAGQCTLRDGTTVDAWAHFRETMAKRQTTQLPNPSATYCLASGGIYESIKDKDGAAIGVCVLNGKAYDAWELFRSSHSK